MSYKYLLLSMLALFVGLSLTLAAGKAGSLFWVGCLGSLTVVGYLFLLTRAFK